MIIFLSDTRDYANIMKAVIRSLNPEVAFMDLSNDIKPFDVVEGAWLLANNYFYFPKGSIFLCVVDPGVGSDRVGIIVQCKDYVFIGPDNGLMYTAAKDNGILRTFAVDEGRAGVLAKAMLLRKYRQSSTFHGRDIFSVVAASLESQYNMQFMGKTVQMKERLDLSPSDRKGMVVSVDHYGNVVTNLFAPVLLDAKRRPKKVTVRYRKTEKTIPLYTTYADAKKGELFALVSSNTTLELAKKEASAASLLKARTGDAVELLLQKI